MRISRTQPNHSTHTSCEQPTQLKICKKYTIKVRKKFLFSNIFLL
jgi:hypothetical protein